MRHSRRVPGRGYARARARGRCENAELVRASGSSAGRNRGDGTVFRACRKERIAAMANRVASSAKAGLPDAWRTGRGPIAAASNYAKFPLEGGRGQVFGHCGNRVIEYQKMDGLFDSETTQIKRLKRIKFENSFGNEETFLGEGSSILARPLAG